MKDQWLCEDLHLVIQDDSFDHSYGPISLFGPTFYDSIPARRDEMELHRLVDRALKPDKEINDGFILTMTAVRCLREVWCSPGQRWMSLYKRLHRFHKL